MKKLCYYAVAATMFLAACNESLNEATEVEKDSNESNVEQISNKSHWGNKIEDPYTVDNMRLAFKELMKKNNSLSKAGVSVEQIEPTHLHLKFIPKNEEELKMLNIDTILNVVPVPFDYDLEGFDGVYRDPECPEGQPTYQYSVVRINHKLPNVEYIVLDSLFMPFEDDYDQETISKKAGFKQIWNELEDESLKLTGNLDDDDKTLSKKSRVTPSGYVLMKDFSLGKDNLGVPNVKLHMNFSTHQATTHTNADGYYIMPHSFKNKIHTHVYFQNGDYYSVNASGNAIAHYRGRITPSSINYYFDKKDEANYAATIMRAAYSYFNNVYNLKRPPHNKFYKIGLQTNNKYTTEYGGHYDEGDNVKIFIIESELGKADAKSRGLSPNNTNIFGKNKEIYATTIYGLAYCTLLNNAKDFVKSSTLFNESYLACVSWFLTSKLYDSYNPKDFRHNYRLKNSGFFIDMIDPIDSSERDNVSGYTMQQIESLICNYDVWNIHNVVDEMPKHYTNSTSNGLYDLMVLWESSWAGGYTDK